MVLTAGACSHAGPARAASVECRTIAKAPALAGADADAACALVRERVEAALATSGASRFVSLTIDLDLSRPGSAIAKVVENPINHIYPDIAVDVMDRAVRHQDLVRLADAIAATVAARQQQD